MKVTNSYYAFILAVLSLPIYGMSPNSIKEQIEKQQAKYLAVVGTQDAAPEIQKRSNQLIESYKKSGLLEPKDTMIIKYMSPEFIKEYLEKQGCVSWNNCINNGKNIIHVDPRHSEFTHEESAFFLGHEIAHKVVRQNSAINPHAWGAFAHMGSLFAGAAVVVPSVVFSIAHAMEAKNLRLPRPLFFANLFWTSCAIIHTKLANSLEENISSGQAKYKCLQKTEEVICDVLAAHHSPGGAKAGASLFKRFLDKVGDTSGTHNDHPKTTTRIAYLNLISKFQRK